ncbi:MAG TPA: hypothetical protein VMT35_02305 [Ignavibacteriaceae bacterium]|nr:hypothetical protein [Ignavibacteriaceae bacterium]
MIYECRIKDNGYWITDTGKSVTVTRHVYAMSGQARPVSNGGYV